MVYVKKVAKNKNLKKKGRTTSTLKIPKLYLAYFKSRTIQNKGARNYFNFLIKVYARNIQKIDDLLVCENWKTKYQNQNLELHERHFVPDPECWEEFRHIALAYGVSMCKLFVILMALEKSLWEKLGCPEDFAEIVLENIIKKRISVQKPKFRSVNTTKANQDTRRETRMYRNIDYLEMKLTRKIVFV